jgi:hypothetical protein
VLEGLDNLLDEVPMFGRVEKVLAMGKHQLRDSSGTVVMVFFDVILNLRRVNRDFIDVSLVFLNGCLISEVGYKR